MPQLVHIGAGLCSVVVDVSSGVPCIAHWGAQLNDLSPNAMAAFAPVQTRPSVYGALDSEVPLAVVPSHGDGSAARPGIGGHRPGGRHWSPRFSFDSLTATPTQLTTTAIDRVAELRLVTVLSLGETGALLARATLTNTGTTRYLLTGLSITLPLASRANELITYDGRWSREFHARRQPWTHGAWTAENRAGRTSHEHPPLIWALERGAGEWHGQVWGAHLAWSGNHVLLAEILPDGRRYIQLGELLHPGEVCLEPGESYSTPEVIGVWSNEGITPASWGFHRHVRSVRPAGASSRARAVLLNTWEAVYFNHDVNRLKELADVASNVGIERFVLDDGWFGSRRNDKSGLGDWVVSADVYPDGLGPLIAHVRNLQMEFGIWVEPEMVNPDSDLFRAHPEWALVESGYEPILGRNQLVLNLAHPDAYSHIFGQLDALLREHDISYIKWDMNRNHVHGSGRDGAAGTHSQTLAVYKLIDALRATHPSVEIESCASGGGRVDHEILRRTERVWTSDCNDPLERQTIQRGASMFIPAEVMGAHIGPARSHTTGRRHDIGFRGITALFGHLGVEWNILRATGVERQQLAQIIAVHKKFRSLLHGGETVRFDSASAAALAHGVYSIDRTEALLCYAQLRTATNLVPEMWKIPGLQARRIYVVECVPIPGGVSGATRTQPSWLTTPIRLTGEQLAVIGIRPPVLHPETAVLVHLHSQ